MNDSELIKLLANVLQDLAFCVKHGSLRQLSDSRRKAESILKLVEREV